MIVPVRLVVALALFLGAAVRAEAAPSRTKRERPVTITGNPAEPLPGVHIATDTPTVLLFPADILKKTLTVDETRIRVVDTGARSIIVQAVPGFRADERHELEVYFADGESPARAAFMLVMDPAEVDTRIDVQRPALTTAGCPPEAPRAAPLPEDFVLLDFVDNRGVQTAAIRPVAGNGQGLRTEEGMSYRGKDWVLFHLKIKNEVGNPPFSPRGATLRGKDEVTLRALRVKAERDVIAPGESGRVLVVADEPAPSAGVDFALEVLGDDGRSLVIPRVTLPTLVMEGKP